MIIWVVKILCSSSVYSCHLFLISSASVRFLPFLSFIEPIFAWNVPFIGDWNAKVGSQETPGITGKFDLGSTEWSRAKANRVSPRECTGHSKHPLPTTQEKISIYAWISPDGQHRNQIDYILCSQRWRCSIQSAKTRLGTDCGSDLLLLLSHFSRVRLCVTP